MKRQLVGPVVADRDPALQHVADHPVMQDEPDGVDELELEVVVLTSLHEDRTELVRSPRSGHDQAHRRRVPDPADGVLQRLDIRAGDEVFCADDLDGCQTLMRAPGNQLRPLTMRGDADDVRRRRTAQRPRPHFTAPIASPPTKCFWKRRNTATVGTAAITVPAAITFHDDTNSPCRPSRAGVTGIFSPERITVIDHSRSLKIHVNDSAPSAASAGRVNGRITLE